jgi:D-alanyl-D-alanine carboxypeptidase (penicillin-binding protein 5/6)
MKSMPRFIAMLGVCLASALSLESTVTAQELSAAAYVIIDHNSGHVLEGFNAGKKLQVASLTKIATVTVVLDWAHASNQSLDQLITVPVSAQALNSQTGAGLAPGDQATLRDLMYAALLQSDNAAAETLASHVGLALSKDAPQPPNVVFVSQMNALARKLGMTDTRFLNAHGLDTLERKLPYSTANDIAKVTAYAMSNAAFRFLVSQTERRIVIRKADGSTSEYRLKNTNELLGRDAIDGVKTGTTQRAGQCVVISSARSPEVAKNGEEYFVTPRRLEVVVLGSQNRFAEAALLLKRGWAQFDQWVSEGRPTLPPKGLSTATTPLTTPSR